MPTKTDLLKAALEGNRSGLTSQQLNRLETLISQMDAGTSSPYEAAARLFMVRNAIGDQIAQKIRTAPDPA